MGKYAFPYLLILLLNLGTLLTSLAGAPYCPPPPKHPHPPTVKPPYVKPPHPPSKPPVVKPPYVKPPPYVPKPPVVTPPYVPKPPPYVPKPPPTKTPCPPPPPPRPPYVPKPPVVTPPYVPKPPPTETPCPPPPPRPPAQETCPIDTLKLGACVDLLGGLVHIGIGSSAKDSCCPVLQGLVDLDAAVCLCTTIKLKLLNISVLIPLALEVLVGCGKTAPPGFKCS